MSEISKEIMPQENNYYRGGATVFRCRGFFVSLQIGGEFVCEAERRGSIV
jgi:hypothetical protein